MPFGNNEPEIGFIKHITILIKQALFPLNTEFTITDSLVT
jgi:hypothetical protein